MLGFLLLSFLIAFLIASFGGSPPLPQGKVLYSGPAIATYIVKQKASATRTVKILPADNSTDLPHPRLVAKISLEQCNRLFHGNRQKPARVNVVVIQYFRLVMRVRIV